MLDVIAGNADTRLLRRVRMPSSAGCAFLREKRVMVRVFDAGARMSIGCRSRIQDECAERCRASVVQRR